MKREKFTADFGKTAEDYARHRASYPDWFFERLMRRGLARPGMQALDLATGTGYLARGLAQRGLGVAGLDVSADMMAAAKTLDAAQGLTIDYIVGKAEETGLPTGVFDLVTAACAWHWFDRPKASAEATRLLRPGGWLVVCSQDWLPIGANVVARSEAIIQRYNPAWPYGGLDGMKPSFVRDLRTAGFQPIESFSVDFDIPYSHEGWRGRMRASAGVSGSLSPDEVRAFDAELGAMLARDFPQDPLRVPHCLFAVMGRKRD
ncbi:class I SAM-dependent methyltransferase [Dongia deserti]|uniref:class I SAM-dependent methyltransferase n=1 Tax=Dongia deserti TaxID=2268030 RepID=UPI000E64C46A|nr:class I SAM-dependent methyltransferase [Dongia deserti]